MSELNITTCRPGGANHPAAIYVDKHHIRFTKQAEVMLGLKPGDKVSFQLRDGILKMIFDPKTGFKMRNKAQGHNTFSLVIYNTDLSANLIRLRGQKIAIGEFSDGGYLLTRY